MKRKSLLFLLLLALGLPWAVNAAEEQTLTVYNGTDNNSYVPFYGLYADDGVKCEFVIPADQLEDMTNGTISAMKFYLKSTGTNTISPTFTVFVKEVESTTLTALTGTAGATTVFNNSITFTSNTTDVEIDIPFSSNYSYEGGNLLIGIYQDAALGSGNYTSTSWYGVNQNYNSAWSGSGNGSGRKFLPKTTFTYTPGSGPTCAKPETLVADPVTAHDATLTWTGGSGEYNVQYKEASDDIWNDLGYEVPYTSYSFSSDNAILDPNTTYDFRVQSWCGTDPETNDDIVSAWKTVSFTTPCDSYDIPYTYGFEEAAPFDCWTVISGNITRISGTPNTGNYRLDFRGTTSNMIALPQFNEGTNNLRVEFYTRPESTSSNCGKFAIGYMTDINDASTFVAVETYPVSDWTTASYVKKTVDFVNAPAGANIAMRQFDCSTNYYWYVDDVTVKEIPSCLAPTGLAATNITTNSATITWTPGGNETKWRVEYNLASVADPFSGTTGHFEREVNDEPTYTITDFPYAATSYVVRVIAICGDEDESEGSEVLTITTACDVITALGYSENFDSYTVASAYTAPSARVLPTCWNAINTTTNSTYSVFPTIYYYSSTNYANSTPNSLKLYSYYSSYSDYDPQPQYAILPEMTGLAGTQVRLMARGYNATSTFKIGTMSDPTDASTFTMIAEQELTTSYPEEAFEYNIPANCTDSYLAIMIDAATSSRTYNGAYIDDIVIVEAPTCIKPTGLAVTANSVTSDGATITWTVGGDETQWQIEYATDADFTNPLYETVEGEPTYTFHGLDDATTYYVHVQAVCGGSNGSSEYSATVNFTTLQTPANLPYANDFESTNDWLFVNGNLTNAWAYGEATSNGEGTHALYISNDGGTTNAYSNSSAAMVYATKLFNFEAGTYVFSYDWKANGESTYDFLRVVLVPSSVTLTAGTSLPSGLTTTAVPSGWIAIDGGSKLNLKDSWQSFASNEIEIAAGTYMMVFAWRDDTSGGSNPPAAIDNVSIEVITCLTPTGLAVVENSIAANSVELSWTENGEATAWQIELTDEEDNIMIIDADSNPFTLTDLTPESIYAARVRAYCDANDQSRWSEEVIFETAEECQTPDGLAATEVTSESAVITWNTYGLDDFNLQYTTDGENWMFANHVNSPYTLTQLESSTTYQVQVVAACNTSSASPMMSFTTKCEAITISKSNTFSEGFEGYTGTTYSSAGVVPTCWDSYSTGSVAPHIIGSGSYYYHHDGTNALTFYGSGYCYAAIPEFTNALSELQIKFWMQTESASNGSLVLGYITAEDNNYSTFTVIETYDNSNGSMVQRATMLNELPAEATRLVFRWYYTGQYSCCIDDVEVSLMPTCFVPTELAWVSSTTTEATISWTAGGNETVWEIMLNDDEEHLIGVDFNAFTFENLTASTIYTAKVRAYCSEDDQSEWSTEISFATECEPFTITAETPYTQNFEAPVVTTTYSGIGEMPTCWDNYPVNVAASAKILAAGAQYNFAEEGQVLYFYGSGNNYAVLPEFSNALNTLQISFKYAVESTSYGALTLGYITDEDENYNTFTAIGDNYSATTAKSFVTVNPVNLSSLPANATRLVFKWAYNGQWGCNVDDVEVALMPSFTKTIEAHNNDGGWYLIASPLNANVAPDQVANLVAETAANYDLYSFDQTAAEEWYNYKAHTDGFVLEPGKGYLYANAATVDLVFTGAPYNGNGEVSLDYFTTNENAAMHGWNLIGNPFSTAATVDMASYRMSNSNEFISTAAGSVEAMEGLLVMATEAGQKATFTQASRAANETMSLALNLSQNNKLIDRAIVSFNEGNMLPKLQLNPNHTKVYIPQDNKDYAVVYSEGNGEMPVSFKAEKNGSYTFAVNAENVVFSYLHLIDNMTGADVDLLATPSYSFDAKTTDYASRFRLVFATGNSSEDSFAFFSNGSFVINNEGNATLQVVDVMGRILKSETINGCANVNVNAAPGVYMLRLVNGDNVKVQKVVVR